MNQESVDVKSSKGNASAFLDRPEKVRFETQEKGEEIILLLRAHVITLIPWILFFAFLLVLPIIAKAMPGNLFGFLGEKGGSVGGAAILFWYLATLGFALWKFSLWYFNIYLVTNERVVDFDFIGLTYKSVSDAQLSKIQDVTSRMVGVFHVFFNYGHVFVQTAAAMREFEFHDVPKPDIVARTISEQVRLEEGEAPGEIK
ncbi:MAG TPA: PH domain-containing protein [Patescibacteria group bacterium]